MYRKCLTAYVVALLAALSCAYSFTSQEVKCHVCKATVQEMEEAIAKEDPKKRIDISGFRMDSQGNTATNSVQLIKSEVYLQDLMDDICEKMEDYLKATDKKTGKLVVLKMIVDGKMNPESSNVDFVQDGDLNKSLEHFCLEVLEDHETTFLKAFQADPLGDDLDIRICSQAAQYCTDAPVQEEYEFDEKDEL